MRLIDADKFKEELMKLWDYSCVDGITATTVLKQVLSDLDNAPTVEAYTSEDIVKYISATEDLVREKYERPSGEWVIVKDKRWGDNVKCPFCGKELAGTDLNFCCKCGAKLIGSEKMNGGAEE